MAGQLTVDQKVQLAEKIAKELSSVGRNEWQRWANYFAQHRDLNRAIQFANTLSNSVWMRREPKEAAQKIVSVMGRYNDKLRDLSQKDVEELFGYVSRCLVASAQESSGSRSERGGGQRSRPPGRRPDR